MTDWPEAPDPPTPFRFDSELDATAAARAREALEILTTKNHVATREVARLRQSFAEQTAEIDMLRAEAELLVPAKREAYALAMLSIQRAEVSETETRRAREALTSAQAALASVNRELEIALVERADACRQRDAMRVALRRASSRAAGWEELERLRADIAAQAALAESWHTRYADQVVLTDSWHARYDGLRARIEAILRRTGVAWAVRTTPPRLRQVVRRRLLGPGPS